MRYAITWKNTLINFWCLKWPCIWGHVHPSVCDLKPKFEIFSHLHEFRFTNILRKVIEQEWILWKSSQLTAILKGAKKMLYMSFSKFLIDLCEIMSLVKSSALRGVIYLRAEKKICKHLVHFPSCWKKNNSMPWTSTNVDKVTVSFTIISTVQAIYHFTT
jgi:hypothetical protein